MREYDTEVMLEVLVVEHVKEDREDLASVFRDLGIRIILPHDSDPMRFLAARSVDLLVLNLHYPGFDPFPLLALAKKKGIRTLVVARSFHHEEARSACRLGAENVWDLPLDRDRFTHSLRQFFPNLPALPKKILVIDDVEETRSIFARTLREGSFHVLEARTGREGLFLARTEEVDLILLDIGLPDINGMDLHARFRKDPITASIPILVCTVRGKDEEVPPGEAYIQKPISPAGLLEQVSGFLTARSREC